MSEKDILKYLDSIKFYNYTTCLDPVDTDLGKLQRKEKRALKIARSCVVENKKLQQENQELKTQLKQRDEVIDEINNIANSIRSSHIFEFMENSADYKEILFEYDERIREILQKHKGDNK